MARNHIKEYISIGQVRKSHGLDGILKSTLYPRTLDAALKATHFFIHTHGQKLPVFIEWIEGEGEDYQIKFEDIDDPQSAGQMASKELYMDKKVVETMIHPTDRQLPLDFEDLIGWNLYDITSDIRVKIDAVIELPGQIMAKASLSGREFLLPLAEALIEEVNPMLHEIKIRLPHGIFEL